MVTYYVKNGGSNSNTGLSDEQAFATPEHAHSIAVAGDKILLKRGSKWFGFTPQKAGTSGNPIIWDAYGEGEKPIIHGLKTITGWTDIGGGFWKVTDTDILTRSKFIKIDNALSTVARSPRTNYYQSTGATGSTAGTVTDTGFLNGKDFTGGEVVFRKNSWIVDTMLITAHSGSTIDYSGGSTTNAVTGWGYAIQNHRDVCIEELDWCQEEDDIVIYFDSIDPTSVTVEVPVIEKIDFASRGYNFFNNIVFEGFNGGSDTTNENPCFLLSASQQVKFLAGCEFKNMGNTVFHFIANNNNGFELNGISAKDCLNIFLWNRHSSTTPQFEIINSEFEDIGNVLGAGGNGPNGYSCIIFAGSSGPCTVSGNRLKNIGYNAINFGGFEYIVEKNVVENSCSQMADGGSYYTFGKSDVAKTYVTANRILRKNVAIDSPGNAYGTPLQFSSGHPTSYMSEGIYLDDDSKNITIEDNYATGCRAGLKCQNNKDHIFSGNIFHKNISIQCLFANNNNGAFDIENINFQNNILYSDAGQLVIQFESKNNDFDIFGTFNNNYYMRPANEEAIIRHLKTGTDGFDNLLSLAQWKVIDHGSGVFYDVDSVGTPTTSTISNAYYNDTQSNGVVQDIERIRMDVDGVTVNSLTLDSFESVLLLDDLGPLEAPTYEVIIAISPVGFGTVEKDPAGPHEEGTEVILTATPAAGKQFVGWYDGVTLLSVSNPYTYITGNSNKTITAEFQDTEILEYTISFEISNGTADQIPDGPHTQGSSVIITADINEDYSFEGWYINSTLVSMSNPYNFTMPGANVVIEGRTQLIPVPVPVRGRKKCKTYLNGFFFEYDCGEIEKDTDMKVRGIKYKVLEDLEYEPVTVEFLKQHIRVDFDMDDNLIGNYLKSARQTLEKYGSLSFGVKKIRFSALNLVDNFPLDYRPIVSIVDDTYELFGNTVVDAGGEKITFDFLTGWEPELPEDIKVAICQFAAGLYADRENILSVTTRGYMDQSKKVIDGYRNYHVV
jgi:parallel beta-helix repeat protein